MKLTRTIVLESHRLTGRKQAILQDIITQYERVLRYLVRKAVDDRITSHITLRKTYIDYLKQNYTLKTHYYYEAARQAVQIYKSFKKRKTKKQYPEIRNITVSLDDQLWSLVKITGKTLIISLATPRNRVYIPLKLNKRLRNKLHNIGFGLFKRVILDKAVEYGVKVIFVNPAYSSSTCPVCNLRVNSGRDRVFRCPSCGFVHDRDVVALFNLESRGLGVLGLKSS